MPPIGVLPPVDTRASYLRSHIPRAVFFDIDKLSDHASPLPHTLPTPEAFSRAMSALGIGSEMSLVIYEQAGVFSAPRAWWMLRTFGAKSVYLLDGGMRAWLGAGLPVESGEAQRPAATFHASLDPRATKSFDEVQEMIASRAQTTPQILDARSSGRFAGTAPEPRAGIRSGHMPSATSVPFTDLVEDGRMKSAEMLRSLFAARGVNINAPVTTTCGSGVTAAVIVLALEIAGAKDVSLYDGSWAEYSQHPAAVIESSS